MSDGLIPNSFTLRQCAQRERRVGEERRAEEKETRQGDREVRHKSQTAELLRVSRGIRTEWRESSSLEKHKTTEEL